MFLIGRQSIVGQIHRRKRSAGPTEPNIPIFKQADPPVILKIHFDVCFYGYVLTAILPKDSVNKPHPRESMTRPRNQLPFIWPDPPFNLVLVEPEIPQNTGNIARLCAATGTILNLIEPLGFRLTDREVKRAGLDYWDSVQIQRHASFKAFLHSPPVTRHPKLFFFSTSGTKNYTEAEYRPGDCLIFGSESRGLPLELLEARPNDVFNIPMRLDHVRSLNLANAASIVLYEALRQINTATNRN